MPAYDELTQIRWLVVILACASSVYASRPVLCRLLYYLQTLSLQAPPASEADPIATSAWILTLSFWALSILSIMAVLETQKTHENRTEETSQRKTDEVRGITPVMEIQADGSYTPMGETTEKPPERLVQFVKYANEHIDEM